VSALKQLSELRLGTNYLLRELPADLGVRLPALRVLRVDDRSLSTGLPSTLHALSHLEVAGSGDLSSLVRGEQLGALSSLRHLALNRTTLHNPGSLSLLTGLRVLSLVACDPTGVPCRPGQLAGLGHLCRFHQCGWLLRGAVVVDPSAFVKEGSAAPLPLQHLTHLSSSSYRPRHVLEQLPTLGTLPRLQQLILYGTCFTQLAPLGPWLAQQTALTQLHLCLDKLASVDELRHLPQQLLELSVTGSYAELPLCLTRLSALKELSMYGNPLLQQLPGWLSCMSRLEVLHLDHTGITTQQEVLAALPLLRQVKLSGSHKKLTPAEVLASAPHLLFAPSG
jgi:Leucine-rich repeat (LRR) protein